ncbi:hypothetical protein ACWDV4_17165 [Micromonospora sp. NPDC003197]
MSDAYTPGGRPATDPLPVDVSHEPADPATEPDELVAWREPDDDDRPPVRGASRRRRILLGSALLVSLVAAGGLGAVGWRVADQKDAQLEAPAQVAGLVRDDSERARTTADYLRSGFVADIEVDRSIGAVYSDPADAQRTVLLFGGTTLLLRPEHDLDTLFELLSDEGGAVTGIREVPAGKLGGTMKCGTTSAEDGDLTVCGWADHGSVALAMFSGRDVTESAGLLRKIRETIQTRD